MPKISKDQGPSFPPPAVELYPEAPEPAQPEPEDMADGSLETVLDEQASFPKPTTGIGGTVTGDGHVTPYPDDTDTDANHANTGEDGGDSTEEQMTLPAQNAVKAEWEQALLDAGVSADWLGQDENGRSRSKADLIEIGHGLRDGELEVVDGEPVNVEYQESEG
jgi:hypothetical protein